MSPNTDLSRGAQTREALIEAAIDVFGRDGFNAASTRSIAKLAGVNQALIGYHFGGKEALYLAAFESVADQMGAILVPMAQEILHKVEGVNLQTPGHKEISVDCMQRLLGAILNLFGKPETSRWIRLVIREQQDPTRAFDLLWDSVMSRVIGLLNKLVSLALDADPEADSTRAHSLLVLTQVMGVFAGRGTTARHMRWDDPGSENIDLIREQLFLILHAQFLGASSQ